MVTECTDEIRVGDSGTVLIVKVSDAAGIVDLSGGPHTLEIFIQRPDSTLVNGGAITASTTTDGSDGQIQVTSDNTYFTMDGTYKIQGAVALNGGWSGRTCIQKFDVLANLG